MDAAYVPIVISTDLSVGPNRFVLGLLDREDKQALGADLHLRFFSLEGGTVLKFETDAKPIRLNRSFTHTHNDGTIESHEAGETGVYVAGAEFETAGQWGVEVSGVLDGRDLEAVTTQFPVRAESFSPAIGDLAPRSVQPILSDVSDIKAIDTSETPIPGMHDQTIADAVASGRPTVIVFATPAFCVSQICGPSKQIVDELFETYKAQANFIHVEPYDVAKARAGDLEPLPLIEDEWGLQTEPWIFVIDGEGAIAAKFEGVVSREEVEDALKAVVAGA